jgi:plastocyanin
MSRWTRMTFALLWLAAATACGSSSMPASPTPTTASVTITSSAFTPNVVTVSIGSSVMWMNKDSGTHSIVADGGAFGSGALGSGAQYSYMFPSSGTFTYHDGANPSMVGTVTVSGSSSPSPY